MTSATTIGGSTKSGGIAFTTTHWSVAQGQSPAAHEALENFAALIGDLSMASLDDKVQEQKKPKT